MPQKFSNENSPGISEFHGRFAPSLQGIRQTQTYSRHFHISLLKDRVKIIWWIWLFVTKWGHFSFYKPYYRYETRAFLVLKAILQIQSKYQRRSLSVMSTILVEFHFSSGDFQFSTKGPSSKQLQWVASLPPLLASSLSTLLLVALDNNSCSKNSPLRSYLMTLHKLGACSNYES